MNKDYGKVKLLEFDTNKQIKVLYDLALFIENKAEANFEQHLLKLSKYHEYLADVDNQFIQKLSKEFSKIKKVHSPQFQNYIMHLERFLGQSTKEYQFLIQTHDKANSPELNTLPLVCVLDSIRSAHNIGTMLRNAECFGVQKVYLTGLSPGADHPSVIKTAMGTEKMVAVEYQKNSEALLARLKEEGHTIIGVETAENAHTFEQLPKQLDKVVLVFGHEQFGISLETIKQCDHLLKLQMRGNKNSLNVATCQGIVLNLFSDYF